MSIVVKRSPVSATAAALVPAIKPYPVAFTPQPQSSTALIGTHFTVPEGKADWLSRPRVAGYIPT